MATEQNPTPSSFLIREYVGRTSGLVMFMVPVNFGKRFGEIRQYVDHTDPTIFSITDDDWAACRVVGLDGPEPIELAEGRWAVVVDGVAVEDFLADAQEAVKAAEALAR